MADGGLIIPVESGSTNTGIDLLGATLSLSYGNGDAASGLLSSIYMASLSIKGIIDRRNGTIPAQTRHDSGSDHASNVAATGVDMAVMFNSKGQGQYYIARGYSSVNAGVSRKSQMGNSNVNESNGNVTLYKGSELYSLDANGTLYIEWALWSMVSPYYGGGQYEGSSGYTPVAIPLNNDIQILILGS